MIIDRFSDEKYHINRVFRLNTRPANILLLILPETQSRQVTLIQLFQEELSLPISLHYHFIYI